MDGRSRPYFLGVDRTLNFQQKEALAQGILQVVETIPEGFESFEFQFTGHQVHIYKLDHGIILLVLTRNELVYSDYLKTIKNLKAALQEDIVNAISTFRLVAGNVTTGGLNGRQSGAPALQSLKEDFTLPASGCLAKTSDPPPPPKPLSLRPLGSAPPPPPPAVSPRVIFPPVNPVPLPSTEVNLKELLASLNHLSQFTTRYLGPHVIVNYWKCTRPNHPWLLNFQIDRSGQFTFKGDLPQELQRSLNAEQHQWVQEWVTAFIQRSSKVIRNFSALIEQDALNEAQKRLLLS